MQGTC